MKENEFMPISCHCLANIGGKCAAEVCKGEIIALDIGALTPEQAKWRYKEAALIFGEKWGAG